MEQTQEPTAGACPFCAFWTALKKSEAGHHLRQIKRETLLLARSIVGSGLRTAEKYASRPAESTRIESQP